MGMTTALQKTVQFFDLVQQRKLEVDPSHVSETLSTIYGSIKQFVDHYQRLPELREQFSELQGLLEATTNLLNKYTGYRKYM